VGADGSANRGGAESRFSLVHAARRSLFSAAWRVAVLGAIVGAILLAWPPAVRADQQRLPVALEAELVAKVLVYDRTFQQRAGAVARLLIVAKEKNANSLRVASQMRTALGNIGRIGGLPHEEIGVEFTTAKDLAELCTSKQIAVAYFGPGFDDDLETIRTALDGHEVLTMGSVPQYVPRGIVLGFDVVAGYPKVLFNLTQARRQHISMTADLLKIARVFE
jgi:hypothetical protein